MKITIENATVEEKRVFITKLLEEANSQFVSIEFTKADGTNRLMTVQQSAMQYHVKGDEASESAQKAVKTRKANNPNLMAVWDAKEKGFRSVNLDTTHTVKHNGNEYLFT